MEGQLNNRNGTHGVNSGSSRRNPGFRGNNSAGLIRRPADVVIRISNEQLRAVLPRLFSNKVILAFAGSYTVSQAKSWIKAFNCASTTKLEYIEGLVNSLFVASVEEHPGGLTRQQLAEKNYHQVHDQFATINLYASAFDPQSPLEFKYLITIRIRKGTRDTFALLDDILKHIGTVADRDIADGEQHHMIIALVSTQLRTFTHNALVTLDNNKVLYVELDFFEPYLRCTRCFSLEHSEVVCTYQPRLLIAIPVPIAPRDRVRPIASLPSVIPGPPEQTYQSAPPEQLFPSAPSTLPAHSVHSACPVPSAATVPSSATVRPVEPAVNVNVSQEGVPQGIPPIGTPWQAKIKQEPIPSWALTRLRQPEGSLLGSSQGSGPRGRGEARAGGLPSCQHITFTAVSRGERGCGRGHSDRKGEGGRH